MTVDPSGFGGTDPNSGVIDSIRITGFPSNTNSMTIDGITYYAGSLPSGCSSCAVFPAEGIAVVTNAAGQPMPAIAVDPVGNTATTVVIPYVTIDNAHLTSPAPGSLALPFGVPLPLTWRYFTAEPSGNDVVLLWGTATERNTDRFEVEYAADGRHFSKLGTVTAAGNSHEEIGYSLKHSNATALGVPKLQYRIKQLDHDGHYTFSEVRILTLKDNAAAVKRYPNPVLHGGTFTINAAVIKDAQVYNSTGKLVWSGRYSGEKTIQVPAGSWLAGNYQVLINGTQTLKLSVQ